MSIFIGLSSNLDDPRAQILKALERIAALPRTRLARCSSLYRTSPWGYADQPIFWNAVAQIETQDEPRPLLESLTRIERDMGRARPAARWGPRRIDLDLLLYHARRIDEPDLVVPHPRMGERVFVLLPLLEIAPNAGEPGTARPYALCLPRLRRPGDAILAEPPPIRG
ncbi:MAG: 2-amino-4-hydroxy-6-hydroxymethyldihydropteridine diphosphokinase [Candidatus Sumerlaeota bacterium]|nr:2-amino-4-hydroxy-6-hydroxymethyldihydropteridine diphosphokinase [Candidatus Sumerlaeota bacterium]